jgi:geranylgeranyl pyrophosphate synthase
VWNLIYSAQLEERVKELISPYVNRGSRALLNVLSEYRGSIFYEPLLEATRGGKMIRPVLLYLGNEIGGPRRDPDPAAAMVELLHTASLIHDDIIDGDQSRRGFPSFHRRYGLELSILIADFILSIVLRISSMYGCDISDIVAAATRLMSEKEAEESQLVRKKEIISFERYMDIIYGKTAILFETALRIGGMLSAKERLAEDLALIGRNMGLIYQMRDDLDDWERKEELSHLIDSSDPKTVISRKIDEIREETIYILEKLPSSRATEVLSLLFSYIST